MGTFSFQTFGWCLLGILISVVLPPLWSYVRSFFGTSPEAHSATSDTFFSILKPYLALGLASSLTAVLVTAFLGDALIDPKAAILAGYAWDSTLQKLK